MRTPRPRQGMPTGAPAVPGRQPPNGRCRWPLATSAQRWPSRLPAAPPGSEAEPPRQALVAAAGRTSPDRREPAASPVATSESPASRRATTTTPCKWRRATRPYSLSAQRRRTTPDEPPDHARCADPVCARGAHISSHAPPSAQKGFRPARPMSLGVRFISTCGSKNELRPARSISPPARSHEAPPRGSTKMRRPSSAAPLKPAARSLSNGLPPARSVSPSVGFHEASPRGSTNKMRKPSSATPA